MFHRTVQISWIENSIHLNWNKFRNILNKIRNMLKLPRTNGIPCKYREFYFYENSLIMIGIRDVGNFSHNEAICTTETTQEIISNWFTVNHLNEFVPWSTAQDRKEAKDRNVGRYYLKPGGTAQGRPCEEEWQSRQHMSNSPPYWCSSRHYTCCTPNLVRCTTPTFAVDRPPGDPQSCPCRMAVGSGHIATVGVGLGRDKGPDISPDLYNCCSGYRSLRAGQKTDRGPWICWLLKIRPPKLNVEDLFSVCELEQRWCCRGLVLCRHIWWTPGRDSSAPDVNLRRRILIIDDLKIDESKILIELQNISRNVQRGVI